MEHLSDLLLIAGGIFVIIFNITQRNKFKNYDSYLSSKRAKLTTDEYRRFLDQQIAEINSEIEIGKSKIRIKQKYEPAPLLLEALEKVKIEQEKLG